MWLNEPVEMPIPLKSAQYFGSNGLKASASSRWIETPTEKCFHAVPVKTDGVKTIA